MLTGSLSHVTPTSSESNENVSNSNDLNKSSLQNRFLTMLTAELKNQDPTNPMDSTQMVAQLAQLSTTQGINDLKKLTQSEVLALLGSQRLSSSQLIGKTIHYKADKLTVDSKHKNFSGELSVGDSDTDDYTVTIKNKDGVVVKRINVPKGTDGKYHWHWDGKDIHNKFVSDGDYSITASGTSGKGKANIILSNKVSRVEFEPDGSTDLVFQDLSETKIQNVISIGDAQNKEV